MVIFWKKIVFTLKKAFTRKKVQELAEFGKVLVATGEVGLHEKYEQQPEAESALKLAEGMSKLIKSLDGVPEAVVRAGPLLVVKVTVNGQIQIAAETMSIRLRRMLDENPEFLKRPPLLLENLQSQLNTPTRTLETSESKNELTAEQSNWAKHLDIGSHPSPPPKRIPPRRLPPS